jgi:hypothetical protein
MNAGEVIETLMQLGVHVQDAFSRFSLTTAKGWVDFLADPAGKSATADVSQLLAELTVGDIRNAVLQVQAKEKAFLNGRKISELSASDLVAFQALLDVENALVRKELSQLGTVQFWQSLVDNVLPVLISVAKVVIPILL